MADLIRVDPFPRIIRGSQIWTGIYKTEERRRRDVRLTYHQRQGTSLEGGTEGVNRCILVLKPRPGISGCDTVHGVVELDVISTSYSTLSGLPRAIRTDKNATYRRSTKKQKSARVLSNPKRTVTEGNSYSEQDCKE